MLASMVPKESNGSPTSKAMRAEAGVVAVTKSVPKAMMRAIFWIIPVSTTLKIWYTGFDADCFGGVACKQNALRFRRAFARSK